MENLLDPLLTEMKSAKNLSFDEDLIAITTNIIKFTKTITPSSKKMYFYLETYMKRIDSLVLDLFELLNYYLIYGNIFIVSDLANINTVKYLV